MTTNEPVRATSLAHDWISALERGDLEALAALYHPWACLHLGVRRFHGRDAIEDAIERNRLDLTGVVLRRLRFVEEGPRSITFETELEGRFGRILVAHDLRIEDAMIRDHGCRVAMYVTPEHVMLA